MNEIGKRMLATTLQKNFEYPSRASPMTDTLFGAFRRREKGAESLTKSNKEEKRQHFTERY